MMEDVLVIGANTSKYIGGCEDKVLEIYKNPTKNKLIRLLRKLGLILGGVFANIWLADWFDKRNEYNTIILFDTGNQQYIIKILKKRWPTARLILWYWNPMSKTASLDGIDRESVEVWSYHKEDCERYNLKFNTQFFIPQPINEGKALYDIYFVGADKNRKSILLEMKNVFEEQHLSYKFVLTKTKDSIENEIQYSQPISPKENMKNMVASKCIVDIVSKSEFTGFTLRPFEAMNYKKKLITNNPYIKESEFYCANNIFIWGEDDQKKIKDFIDSPFIAIDHELSIYSFENWLSRFFK